MYFWLVIGVLIVWLLLVFFTVVARRRSALGAFTMWGTLGLLTVLALAAVFVWGPYWQVLYRTVLQPG